MRENSKLRTLRLIWYYSCNIDRPIDTTPNSCPWRGREENEAGEGCNETSTWLEEKEWKIETERSFPWFFLPRPGPPHRVYSRKPVWGQCFLSPNLSRPHIWHHQYSSQHPIRHFVAARNILGSPFFSPLKAQKTNTGFSDFWKQEFFLLLPGTLTNKCLEYSPSFSACFHLPKPDPPPQKKEH